MSKHLTFIMILIALSAIAFSFVPVGKISAADYVPLAPLPNLGTDQTLKGNFSDYIPGVYRLAIGIAGVLAVIVILFEGIVHMTSESFTKKSDSAGRIQAAVGGLLLALLAYLLLKAINPSLVAFNLNLNTVPDAGQMTLPGQIPPVNSDTASAQIADATTQAGILRDQAINAAESGDQNLAKELNFQADSLIITQTALTNINTTNLPTALAAIDQKNPAEANRLYEKIHTEYVNQTGALDNLKTAYPAQAASIEQQKQSIREAAGDAMHAIKDACGVNISEPCK